MNRRTQISAVAGETGLVTGEHMWHGGDTGHNHLRRPRHKRQVGLRLPQLAEINIPRLADAAPSG